MGAGKGEGAEGGQRSRDQRAQAMRGMHPSSLNASLTGTTGV